MTKFKRWFLVLTATLLSISVENTESLKATSLIHGGKFSKLFNQTTTTTSTSTSTDASAPGADKLLEILDDVPVEEQYVEVNGTKIALTGIPQIDYVWDPNLPRELNGFNLSSYPFLDSMPADEDIGFDCADKINGFYASIKFGCQLYHHCLYGVRSNFICANFTAFDQKTFICHFASEVDCKNSYKYWNRNDDLYKATTTEKSLLPSSSLVPLIDRNLYKRPSPGGNSNTSPTNTRTNANGNQESSDSNHPQRNNQKEPIGDDDDYGRDPVPRAPNRPLRRPRPHRRRRPQYDYYYDDEEYEDDAYPRRRRPNRRPLYYDDYDTTGGRMRPKESAARERRPAAAMYEDDFDDYEFDRRPMRNQRRGNGGGERRRTEEQRKRPTTTTPTTTTTSTTERTASRRKIQEDPTLPDKRREVHDEPVDQQKSVYDRVRSPSKILRTVPLKEKEKYSYKTSTSDKKQSQEYYDEYEDDYEAPLTTTTTAKPVMRVYTRKQLQHSITTTRRPAATRPTTTTTSTTAAPLSEEVYYYDDDYVEESPASPATTTTTTTPAPKSKVDGLDLSKLNKLKNLNDRISAYKKSALESGLDNLPTKVTKVTTTTTTTTTTTPYPITTSRKAYPSIIGKKYASQTQFEPPQVTEQPEIDVRFRSSSGEFDDPKSFVKIYKRPFLPSRGGSPYKPRGLSPVGPASLNHQHETVAIDNAPNTRTTLDDIYNEEYDVELNDALNPTLKPLTSSRGISSYPASFSRADGYSSRQSIQRADVIASSKFVPSEAITTTTTTTPAPQYEYEEYEYK